jgi:hypothetical protein
LSEPVPVSEPVAAAAQPAPAQPAPARPPGPLRLELAWGRDRRTLSLPPTGGTIGSTTEADVVIPAPFLAPVHARVVPSGDGWAVESLAAGGRGQVMVRGAVVPMAPIAEGDVFRLADRVGNFVTVKVPNGAAPAIARPACLHCGSALTANDVFCSSCGTRVRTER